MHARCLAVIVIAWSGLGGSPAAEPVEVEGQPLAANVTRVLQALDYLGHPLELADAERAELAQAIAKQDAAAIQRLLDRQVLVEVHLNPESRVKAVRGGAAARLQEGGWTPVLIRIANEAHVTAPLRVFSPQGGKPYAGVAELSMKRQEQPELRQDENTQNRPDRFLAVEMFADSPMTPHLSGLEVEYAIALLYSHEAGRREATLGFDVGDGTQDLGFRGETPVLFQVRPAIPVTVQAREADDGQPSTARIVIQDETGRVYPPQAKRLAPDLFFQKQIYRADGAVVKLPPGTFQIQSSRGPEYVVKRSTLTVPETPGSVPPVLELKLERWVNPATYGFFSGDHHIHASGCAHYQSPSVGIDPAAVFQHVKGEGLNVGCVLTWGPGFDHQRQFFSPEADKVSEPFTLIKYDLEISGFGSAALGHVCLLDLKEQHYPGSEGGTKVGWPSWTIPVMRWAVKQGGIAGYAHSASGLHVEPGPEAARLFQKFDRDNDQRLSREEAALALLPEAFEGIDANGDGSLLRSEMELSLERAATRLPNLAIPGMNGSGALEIAISSHEGVCQFISAMDTARIQEWNTWYHLMNCGQPLKAAGETDFPCMSGTRVGQGRTYVKLGAVEKVDYHAWCRGLAEGRSYVSDGYAHALEFQVNGVEPGGEVALAAPGTVTVRAKVAFAPEIPIGVPYGNVIPPAGRVAIGDTVVLHVGENDAVEKLGKREIELVVNGQPVASKTIVADGKEHVLEFQAPVTRSSWVALRHFPQMHTNPVNVIVGGQPIRASKSSALWCVEIIQKLWQNREKNIRESEREKARTTYERAIAHYRKVAEESPAID